MIRSTFFLLPLCLATPAPPSPAPAPADDLSGPRECALFNSYHPCTFTARPEGGYTVKQTGKESFEGTLVPKGAAFHLDGTYRFAAGGNQLHLVGDLQRKGVGLAGEAKADSVPIAVEIRPAKTATAKVEGPAPTATLPAVLATLTTREGVAAGAQLPLRVKVTDKPKLSFTVKSVDEKTWDEKLRGIFGMVPAEHNAGIECNDAKLFCTVTANSGADVSFHFVRTPKGLRLARVELPSEGD